MQLSYFCNSVPGSYATFRICPGHDFWLPCWLAWHDTKIDFPGLVSYLRILLALRVEIPNKIHLLLASDSCHPKLDGFGLICWIYDQRFWWTVAWGYQKIDDVLLYCSTDWCNACNCIPGTFIHNGVCHSRNKYCLSTSDFQIRLVEHSVGKIGRRITLRTLKWIFRLVVAFNHFRHRILHTNPKERIVTVFLVLGLEEEVSPNDERIQCSEWCSDSFQSKCIARR